MKGNNSVNHLFIKYLIVCLITSSGMLQLKAQPSFRAKQKTYSRVENAYAEKWEGIQSRLADINADTATLSIYLRAFKYEKELELWVKNTSGRFVLFNTWKICALSGKSGPKRKQGDLQIPEGFYHIDAFNPWSNFHLSLCINYPNPSDRILSDPLHPGDNICIHGNCVTIGCLPMTDDKIKEIYILCIEAKSHFQSKIPVTIFPARPETGYYINLIARNKENTENFNLWTSLSEAYIYFNSNKKLPEIEFLSDGRHKINSP